MRVKFLGFAAIALGCMAALPAFAAGCSGTDPLTCHGVTYTLSGGTPTQVNLFGTTFYAGSFTLGITGINGPSDSEAGRFGVESLAFSKTDGFLGALAPSGFYTQLGGLNSGGCGGGASANFFCFENLSPITQSVLPADSSLTFNFTVGAWTAADLTSWDPGFKIAWDGTQSWGCAWGSATTRYCDTDDFHSGYDLVSQPLPQGAAAAAPEIDPGSATGALTLLLGGLAALCGWRRKAA